MRSINRKPSSRPPANITLRLRHHSITGSPISCTLCSSSHFNGSRICCRYYSGLRLYNLNYPIFNRSNVMKINPNSYLLNKHNPFHLVEKRPWPLLSSLGALSLVLSGLSYINLHLGYLPLAVFSCVILASYTW